MHIHLVLWVHGAPRIDVAMEPNEDGILPENDATAGDVIVFSEDVASIMSSFFDCIYAEYNIKKHHDGTQASALGEKERHRRDGTEKEVADPCSIPWSQLRDMLEPDDDATVEDVRTPCLKYQKTSTDAGYSSNSGFRVGGCCKTRRWEAEFSFTESDLRVWSLFQHLNSRSAI